MSDIDLHSSYNSSGQSIHDLFGRQEEGFFVPIYQREYTWEEDNINRLFDDLILGVKELSDEAGDHSTTFLGTTILTDLDDKKEAVKPGDERAEPTAVKQVVDGQQRIATIALLSIRLIELLKSFEGKLPSGSPYEILTNRSKILRTTLKRLYSLRLGLGQNPVDQPKIIRALEDQWEFAGDYATYKSPVARYIGTYIKTGDADTARSAVDPVKGARIVGNVDLMQRELVKICDAHIPNTELYGTFPTGLAIATVRMQEYVLEYYDHAIEEVVKKCEIDKQSNDYFSVAIYQLFLFSYYLLRRCGVNRLQPTHQDWGFDMFQALNSTGTPLTALETFLPQVISAQPEDVEWDKSDAKSHLDEIEQLFEQTGNNEQKNRRTNYLFTAARLCFDGTKLGNKFSAQHGWIRDHYGTKLTTNDQRNEFLDNLARLSNFFYTAWYMEDENKLHYIRAIEEHQEAALASMLVQYLKDAGSDMSAPVLARFFGLIQSGEHQVDEFVEATKACAAFFTLWRSARSTSGLDDIYRKFFRGSDNPVKVNKHSWGVDSGQITSSNLKSYFSEVLSHYGIYEKPSWLTASQRFLMYSEVQKVCRFVLFLAGHDRVSDDDRPGLTATGNVNVCNLLSLERWRSTDHKSLEHVAPQAPPKGHLWDPNIYAENRVHHIGNLLLLPADINNLVDGKDWPVKYLHYSHVGERSKEKIDELVQQATKKGIVLSKKATNKLPTASYSGVVEPILNFGIDGQWDAKFIDQRTQQIKEVAWGKLNSWLT